MAFCPAWLAGCQRYAPEPLDLSAHNRAIESRDPASSEVVAYAEQLVRQSGDVPARYDPADGLSLEEAELVALFFNPQLRTARLRARVPLAGAAEAGRWEDPQLNVDAERIIESVEHPWVVGGVISLTLPLSGRLRIEKEMARTSAEVEQLRVLAQERQLLAELRTAWLEWSATAEQAALTRALLNELDAILQTAEKLRAAGELDPLDARLFRIERLTQAGRLQLLEAQGREEEIALKSRLGLSPAADVRLMPSLIAPRRGAAATQKAAGLLELHPRLRVARAEYEMAERTLQLEIRRQYPDLAVGGGFASDEGAERLLGGIGLPLPLWNRNRRAIAEATAAREAARAAVEAEYEQLLAEMAGARAALDAAAARREFVETELAPLVDEQLAAARQLGRLGNYNTLVLLEALKAGYEAKAEVVQARLKMGLATARIHALIESARTADRTERDVQP
jgi:outer membrane protein TolC